MHKYMETISHVHSALRMQENIFFMQGVILGGRKNVLLLKT